MNISSTEEENMAKKIKIMDFRKRSTRKYSDITLPFSSP
jgi:hypothetical protein